MAVLRSYKCIEHGYFDAWEPVCKHGCTDVAQVILKAPTMRDSGRTSRTKAVDKAARQAAMEFNMTDVKSVKEGEFQEGYLTRNNAKPDPREPRPGDNLMWGSGGAHSLSSVLAGNGITSVGPSLGKEPESVGVNLTDPTFRGKLRPNVVARSNDDFKPS